MVRSSLFVDNRVQNDKASIEIGGYKEQYARTAKTKEQESVEFCAGFYLEYVEDPR
jgi:hypothetical protein